MRPSKPRDHAPSQRHHRYRGSVTIIHKLHGPCTYAPCSLMYTREVGTIYYILLVRCIHNIGVHTNTLYPYVNGKILPRLPNVYIHIVISSTKCNIVFARFKFFFPITTWNVHSMSNAFNTIISVLGNYLDKLVWINYPYTFFVN